MITVDNFDRRVAAGCVIARVSAQTDLSVNAGAITENGAHLGTLSITARIRVLSGRLCAQ